MPLFNPPDPLTEFRTFALECRPLSCCALLYPGPYHSGFLPGGSNVVHTRCGKQRCCFQYHKEAHQRLLLSNTRYFRFQYEESTGACTVRIESNTQGPFLQHEKVTRSQLSVLMLLRCI